MTNPRVDDILRRMRVRAQRLDDAKGVGLLDELEAAIMEASDAALKGAQK